MPELPEIETLKNSLMGLIGKKIEKIYFSKLVPIETTSANQIKKSILKNSIHKINRYGKYLLLEMSNQDSLVIHLGMSGQFIWEKQGLLSKVPKNTAHQKHQHMILTLEDQSSLVFQDPRRFGTISLLLKNKLTSNPFLQRLGPDFLDPNLTDQIFIQRCRRHQSLHLKNILLLQSVATGLGNIYACEALYAAKLDPRRLVKDCSDSELTKLLHASRKILKLGIQKGGTSFRDYVNGLGAKGYMKEFLQVYDREGLTSLDGKGPVVKIVQNARSTFFVPKLQK